MIDLAEFRLDFEKRFGYDPRIFSAPGRVNLIGEHTDYNDGFVLPFAIDKRTYVGCRSRDDEVIEVHSRTLDRGTSFTPGDSKRDKGWSLYVRGMAEKLIARGGARKGADMLIDSDIPFGAGLSSSAALEISVGLALAVSGRQKVDLVDLAFAGQEVEHEYMGVRSGIMDQFTSALGKAGHALLIDCRSLAFEHIPLQIKDNEFIVCDSKVEHELASTEYNDRRAQCEEGVRLLQRSNPDVRSLRDVNSDQLDNARTELPEVIFRRCRHVLTENERTKESAKALAAGDIVRLGELMYESHESLRTDYEVTCPELDLLVETAAGIDGVRGARMTGGGFGGCTINIVHRDQTETFRAKVETEFLRAFGRETEVFNVASSDGAREEVTDS